MLVNYIGQLRIYSFVDLILLFILAGATSIEIFGCSLLWFSFLIFLEFIHKDKGRNRWSVYAWIIPFTVGILIIYKIEILFFILSVALYTYKKKYPLGLISPIINGLLKTSLIMLITDDINILLIVFILMTIRNLAGDIRDAYKDSKENIITLPVKLGYKIHTPYVYPLFLGFTSFVWVFMSDMSLLIIFPVWFIQFQTYHLTPR